jgi:1-pyrroline-5-carboxylate dehydrogenase
VTEKFRITYATMSADNEELQAAYDAAAERAKAELGKTYPVVVNGEERFHDETYDEPSPIDKDLLIGRFSQATIQDVDDAVAAAKAFQLEWDRMGWQVRVRILRNVADIMEERVFDLAALMAYEVGKNRLEALGDVQETAELIRWNCDEMEKHDGFRTQMSGLGAAGDYYVVLRPHGVCAVNSP